MYRKVAGMNITFVNYDASSRNLGPNLVDQSCMAKDDRRGRWTRRREAPRLGRHVRVKNATEAASEKREERRGEERLR